MKIPCMLSSMSCLAKLLLSLLYLINHTSVAFSTSFVVRLSLCTITLASTTRSFRRSGPVRYRIS